MLQVYDDTIQAQIDEIQNYDADAASILRVKSNYKLPLNSSDPIFNTLRATGVNSFSHKSSNNPSDHDPFTDFVGGDRSATEL
jgi:hypothetical protein